MKISFIGSGAVAETIAIAVSLKNLFNEIVFLDISEGLAKAKSIDLKQGLISDENGIKVKGTSSYKYISGSDVIVITAGAANKPGDAKNRESLLGKNREIISDVASKLKKVISTDEKQPLIITVTNPLDSILKYFIDLGFNKKKTVGSGNWLDTSRFKYYLSNEFNVSTEEIKTMVIGQHGENMVYLLSQTMVKEKTLTEYIKDNNISQKVIEDICKKSTRGGFEILDLMGGGGTMYGPALSTVNMIESYLEKDKKVLPMSVYCDGEYGIKDCCLGLPVILGKNGIEKIVSIEISKEEKKALKETYEAVEKLNKSK